MGCVSVLQTEDPEFWLMFCFLWCFTQEGSFPSTFCFLAGGPGLGDHKGCGTQGQQVGNFQKQVTWLLSILARCHGRWDCW